MKLLSLRRVFHDGNCNSAPSTCWFKGNYYLSFRTATTRDAPDGRVLVLRGSPDLRHWMVVATIHAGRDTDDPRLLTLGDEMLVYTSASDHASTDLDVRTGFASTQDGDRWSVWEELEAGWIYWYAVSFCGKGYCLAYHAGLGEVVMKTSEDGRSWRDHCLIARRHGAEWPRGASLTFTEDEVAFALLCRSEGTGRPLLCRAIPPYEEWHRTELELRLATPLIWLAEHEVWIGGRWYQQSEAVNSALFRVDGCLAVPQLILPSSGETGCGGTVRKTGTRSTWLLAYASSHDEQWVAPEEGRYPSDIYVAEVELP